MEHSLYQAIDAVNAGDHDEPTRKELLRIRFAYHAEKHPILQHILLGLKSFDEHFDDVYQLAEMGDHGPLEEFCKVTGAPLEPAMRAVKYSRMRGERRKTALTLGGCFGGLVGLEGMLERNDALQVLLATGITATVAAGAYLFMRAMGHMKDCGEAYMPVLVLQQAADEIRE